MQATKDSILTQALTLPEEQRVEIADQLYQSIHGPVDPEVEAAWEEEIARRLKEIDEGRVEMMPWEQVRDELRRMTGDPIQ